MQEVPTASDRFQSDSKFSAKKRDLLEAMKNRHVKGKSDQQQNSGFSQIKKKNNNEVRAHKSVPVHNVNYSMN